MIFRCSVNNLYSTEGASVNKNGCPAVFAGAGDCVAFKVTVCFLFRQLNLSLEILSHRHKELVMRLNIIFLHRTDSNSAGECNTLGHSKIRFKINDAVFVFLYAVFIVINQR